MNRYSLMFIAATAFTLQAYFNHGMANEKYAEISMNEVQAGSLLLDSGESGKYFQYPALDTSIDVEVTGMQAVHKITQTFTNSSLKPLDAVYVFPLPDNAAVDTLYMTVGGREIVGEIQTKDDARRIYQRAKSDGHSASLVERHRPNLFSTQLTNIGPKESIEITIGFQSSVRYDDGIFKLALPTTITPRYKPGMQFQTQPLSSEGNVEIAKQNLWGATSVVAQPNTSTPPNSTVMSPNADINIVLHSGFALSKVSSDSHDLDVQRDGLKWTIAPSIGRIPMDKDFSLSWQPLPGKSPIAAVFAQRPESQFNRLNNAGGGDSFLSLMVIPPQKLFEDALPPREVIFVLDKSGSMGGASMPAAKKALKLGIEGLSANDSFNVVTFSSSSKRMFSRAILATGINKKKALAKVSMVTAGGGTEILGAFKAALKEPLKLNASATKPMRQIVFITDGSVGNEAEVYAYLKQHLGDNRVFTVGIGRAPNRWFMRKAAEHGRGSYTYIATTSEVKEKMSGLFHKINHPVLSDIKLTFNGVEAPEFYPQIVPDLYAGEPLIVNARMKGDLNNGELIIAGNHDGLDWSQSISLAANVQVNQTGLDKQWAYNKISALEDQLLFSNDTLSVKAAATDTALKYGIVSDYTSLVAVDRSKSLQEIPNTYAQAEEDETSRVASASNKNTVASNAVLAAPRGNPMSVPQGNLGIVARLLLSLLLTSGVAIYAKLSRTKNEVN